MTSAIQNTGYHVQGDIVTTTADGRDINALWAEFQATLEIWNAQRQNLVNLLTFPVTQLIEDVPQVGEVRFERATEFGIPQAARVKINYFSLGYSFDDFDIRSAFTWKFLRDTDARQIEANHQAILNGDNLLVFNYVMATLFDNRNRTTRINNQGVNVYALYNNDGTVPPTYKNTAFLSTHNHYMVSAPHGGTTVISPADFEAQYQNIAEHGFGIENQTTFVFMAPKAIVAQIRTWRAGSSFGTPAALSNYDFIPSPTQPTLIVPNAEGLIGELPPSSWNGLPVVGSYRGVLIIEEDYIPVGYSLMFGTGGAGNLNNPVGLREHANPAYRGLRLLPGNQQRYPLVDSFYSRGFGTGIRQRGGAAIMQYKNAGSYDIPAAYNMQSVGNF